MERKFILLIDNNSEVYCYRGEGTVNQVKDDIRELITKKGVSPSNLEVIPVVNSRSQLSKIVLTSIAVFGIGLIGFKIYEGLRKRARERRREHSGS